jgi:hypothetical protein
MQAAFHRDLEQLIYAALEDDFHYRYIALPKRPDGTSQLECVACQADVFGQGGRPGGKQRGHFKHHAHGCPYGHATQSEAHRRLKAFVARCVEAHDGWEAGVEVARHGWRADVLATRRWTIDPDAVFARAGKAEREIVFEIQHTAQSPAVTRRRSQQYQDVGCEIVWLFDRPSGHLGTAEPCVEVKGPDGAYLVDGGIWSPPRSHRPPTSLSTFVTSVLDHDVEYRTVPTGPRPRRCEPPGSPPMAWVLLHDDNELRRQLAIDKRRDDRDRATAQVIERLDANGWPTERPRFDDAGAAYATVIDGGYGPIAVHPYPKNVDRVRGAILSAMSAVIARNPGELRQLAAQPVNAPILLLEDFSPTRAPAPAPNRPHTPRAPMGAFPAVPAAPPAPLPTSLAAARPAPAIGPQPDVTPSRSPAPPTPKRSRRLRTWLTGRRHRRS